MNTYDTLNEYNTSVERARNAYAADQAVANGTCGTCQEVQLDRGKGRMCWRCNAEVVRALIAGAA